MKVYDEGWYISGKALRSFEDAYARFTGVGYCVGVGNGLDALTMALLTCQLSKDDEVIVPAHTYIATWLAISHNNLKIIPVEPDVHTFNIDPAKIESAITSKTKVILPVHLCGQSCEMTAISEIARKHKLIIIEDNAQAHGARWKDQMTGSFGKVNATSFYPTKNLGALGDGGAITTSDESSAIFIRQFGNYGFEKKNIAAIQGVNSRLDEIQAAILNVKLQYINEWNEAKRKLASLYMEQLNRIGDLILPHSHADAYHTYHLFAIRTNDRDNLMKFLASHGIETLIHYPVPPHLQKAYRNLNFKKGDFPITEKIADTILSLPLWPGLKEEEINYITACIKKYFQR
jgi:dTDP-4-amino-4,6-dideoxygalactose transaminase